MPSILSMAGIKGFKIPAGAVRIPLGRTIIGGRRSPVAFRMGGMAFFDRSIITSNWSRINRGPIQKAGNNVRIRARQSIKRRRGYNYYSSRGKTPYSVPVLRGVSPPGTPPRSRQPGSSPPFKQIYSVPFRAGTAVIVGMTYYGGRPSVPALHEHGGRARRRVFYGYEPVRNPATGRYMYRIPTYQIVLANYPKRPFMIPALQKSKRELPGLWAGTFTRNARAA